MRPTLHRSAFIYFLEAASGGRLRESLILFDTLASKKRASVSKNFGPTQVFRGLQGSRLKLKGENR